MFGATDPESLAALRSRPGGEGHEQLGAARRLRLEPANAATGSSATARPSSAAASGIGYDVLFYNLLTVNAINFPRVVHAAT